MTQNFRIYQLLSNYYFSFFDHNSKVPEVNSADMGESRLPRAAGFYEVPRGQGDRSYSTR